MSVEVKSAAAGVFESGPPKTLFQTRLSANDPTQQYAVSPNGRSIYMLQPADAAPTPLTVVLN